MVRHRARAWFPRELLAFVQALKQIASVFSEPGSEQTTFASSATKWRSGPRSSSPRESQARAAENHSELHEALADWLEREAPNPVEIEEIIGYHLEQASHYRTSLGEEDAELALRAGDRLAAAGRRALWRADLRAAAPLLTRSLELTRALRTDVRLELDLARAWWWETSKAAAVAESAVERARAAGDEEGAELARVVALHYGLFHQTSSVDELEELARAVLPRLERAGDHDALVHVWWALAYGVANWRTRLEDWVNASEQALHHARLAGHRPAHLFLLESALVNGPTPADEALRMLDGLISERTYPGAQLWRAVLLAMAGRSDEAKELAGVAGERTREFGGNNNGDWMLAQVSELVGDMEAAVFYWSRFCDLIRARDQLLALVTFMSELGRSLRALERYDEFERCATEMGELVRDLGLDGDENDGGESRSRWLRSKALMLARQRRFADAEAAARRAVALAEETDELHFQAAVYRDLAEVLLLADRPSDAAVAFEHALERYERKRNVPAAARVRNQLAELTAR